MAVRRPSRTAVALLISLTLLVPAESGPKMNTHRPLPSSSGPSIYPSINVTNNNAFIPSELRELTATVDQTNAARSVGGSASSFEGISMGIRLDPVQAVLYRRALFHYCSRSSFMGVIAALTTSSLQLWLSRSTRNQRAVFFRFTPVFRKIYQKRLLNILFIVIPVLLESLAQYVHTLRTIHRMDRTIFHAHGSGRLTNAASRAFVLEQLRHTLLGLPRPVRPPLSNADRLVSRQTSWLTRWTVWFLVPLNVLKSLYALLKRYNNGLSLIFVSLAQQTLPTMVARAYTPFAAVPAWGLWNWFKANTVLTECICVQVGPQMAVDVVDELLYDLKRSHEAKGIAKLVGLKGVSRLAELPEDVKICLVRACAVCILVYSCKTPIPVIRGDQVRPARPIITTTHPSSHSLTHVLVGSAVRFEATSGVGSADGGGECAVELAVQGRRCGSGFGGCVSCELEKAAARRSAGCCQGAVLGVGDQRECELGGQGYSGESAAGGEHPNPNSCLGDRLEAH